ncbi:MAG: hypothetical protein ACFFDK_05170 [Promethearchaeota archaeon]
MKKQNIPKKPVSPGIISQKIIKKPGKVKTISAIMLLAVGLAIMPSGFILSNYIQGEIDNGVKEQVEINPHNEGYEEWETNDYKGAPELYKTFYLWNLTNPDAFLAGGKPVYEEVGPFKFREFTYKYGIDFSGDKDEVEYKQYSKYVQVEGDNISEVYITNINPGFLGGIAFAGGTELQYNKLNLPFVLTQLRGQFNELYTETLDNTLSDHNWIEATQREILDECVTTGISPFISSKTVADVFLDCISLDVLETFLREGMPTSEEVFYAEWANDSFPEFNGNYDDLVSNVHYTGGGIEQLTSGDIENLMRTTLNDNDIRAKMNAIITKQGIDLVDQSGSASGVGVDVEYNLYGETVGSESDLNIVNSTIIQGPDYVESFWEWILWPIGIGVDMDLDTYIISGESGITYDQCVDLWDKSNPNSLTGMDYEFNKVWFEAAENDQDAKDFLTTTFGITETQLDYILKWVNTSIRTWEPNAVEYTLNSWNSGVITKRTVEEWLFNGKDTGIYNFMSYYGKDNNKWEVNIFDNCHNELEAEKAETPQCKIKTGRDDVSEVGQFVEYNGQETITLWAEPEDVEGTNGMQFAPGVTSEDDLKTFQPDLMRVVDLEFKKETEIYDIDLLRFGISDKTFEPNPNYYMNTQGLINLQPLEKYEGVEVRVSKPHMLDVDPATRETVIGMEPNSDDHETYIDVEPTTGLTMKARSSMQVNFELETTEYYMKNINFTIAPILWFEQTGEVTKELAEQFKNMLKEPLELRDSLPLLCLGIGACLAVPGAALNTRQTIKRRKVKKLEQATIIDKIKTKPKGPIVKETISHDGDIGAIKENLSLSSETHEGGDVGKIEPEKAQPDDINTNLND